MTLKNRLKKLEDRHHPAVDDHFVMFISVIDPKSEISDARLSFAMVSNPSLGQIDRLGPETSEAFTRRVYANIAAGQHIDELSDNERADAFAAGEELLAKDTKFNVSRGVECR